MLGNHRASITQRARPPIAGKGAMYRHHGYEDARQGLPFRREYDGWPHFHQMNYERGRQQWALVHRAMGGTERDMLHTPAPKWPRNQYLSTPVDRRLGPGALNRLAAETSPGTFNDMTFAAYLQWFAVGKVPA